MNDNQKTNLSVHTAILDENLKHETATFDAKGMSVIRWAWNCIRERLDTHADFGSSDAVYRIWLDATQLTRDKDLPAGWETPDSLHSPTPDLYSRTPNFEEAGLLTRAEAISRIRDYRASGQSCHAHPPITVTY